MTNLFTTLFSLLVCGLSLHAISREKHAGSGNYTIDNCINEFAVARVESTAAGYQYWFVDKEFVDGRTLKMSVVGPGKATHSPHRHSEDEFFFVLEGKAECYLDGKVRIIGAYASFYCPPNSGHGIRNAGDTELKYLVIKKYQKNNPE